MTTLVLCRHARAGDLAQAERLAAAVTPDALYTSPLERARATAAAIAARSGLEPVVDERLREIDFGEVEGLGFDELPPPLRHELLTAPTRVRFPAGETYEELRVRVVAALEEIGGRHIDGTVVVVTHAGAIRAALATWLQMADDAIFRIDQRHASMNVVDFVDGTPLVRLVNGEAHPSRRYSTIRPTGR